MTFTHLIFDLDGTLTDPLPGMVESINHALEMNGFAASTAEELSRYVGPPLEDTLATLTGSNEASLISRLVQNYRERYIDSGYAQNSIYAGVRELLEELGNSKVRLGVCTSKPAPTARKILRLFELDHYFEFVSGGDVGVLKSGQLNDLLFAGTIDKAALMIGDRAVDINAAKSNQLRSASVGWGYGSHAELSDANPDISLQHPAELIDYLEFQSASSSVP